jgi:hypothetical protein
MNATSLLDELRSRGVTLEARGDRLRFRPANAVPPDLVEQLRANKGEVIALLERDSDRQAATEKALATLEAFSQIGAVRIRTKKFGAIWLALDQATADELRAEEQQREHPRPVLMADDVAHLEGKSDKAIRGALEVIRAFPGARILH